MAIASRTQAGVFAPGLIILALLLIDFVPRFFQGDSLTYVQTNWHGELPAERSWTFGLVVNFLLRTTQGYASFILIQATILAAVIAAACGFFRRTASCHVAYVLTAIALSLDPLLEAYVRFYMTDLLATVCFVVCLLGLTSVVSRDASRRSTVTGLLVFALGALAAISLRVAALPALGLTGLLVAMLCWRRLRGRNRVGLAVMVCIPVLAAVMLAAVNAIVFARQFPNEIFLVKMSGHQLAGAFAPALDIQDFEKAGISITPEEFQNLELTNDAMRWAQIWAPSGDHLSAMLGRKLNASFASDAVDRVEQLLVRIALLRSPQTFVGIYLRNWWDYIKPSPWAAAALEELGLRRPLPLDFVEYFNSYSATKLTPGISLLRSPVLQLAGASFWLYPLLLGLGVCSAVYLMVRDGVRPAVIVLNAGLFADLIAVPLYHVAVVPRYMMPAIFVSYLLIGLAGARLFAGTKDTHAITTTHPDPEATP